jgi:uncharacterized protein (TIGR03118 family)
VARVLAHTKRENAMGASNMPSDSDVNNSQQKLTFYQTNIVSDGSVPADHTDPDLINPWGVAFSANGPFWVADNSSGFATIYNGSGKTVLSPITVAPPPGATGPAAPTGEVFNSTGGKFNISAGGHTASSIFLWATEDGTISGWNPSINKNNSVVAVDNSHGGKGAVYKGLAIANTEHGPRLYAANFRSGKVEVYNDRFKLVKTFTDKSVPAGYAPFNVQVLDNKLFVTYAVQNAEKHDDVAGPGNGFVDEYDLNGHMIQRVASHGSLNSPWGLAIAPSDFGKFAGDLLVGNFGDGTINAYDINHGDKPMGPLLGENGKPITIGDLWSLKAGNGGMGGSTGSIYFTAGVSQEMHGLFGSLTPEPPHTT